MAIIAVIVLVIAGIRAATRAPADPSAQSTAPAGASPSASAGSPASDGGAASDAGGASSASPSAAPAVEPTADDAPESAEIAHTGVVVDGTWAVAAPTGTEHQASTVHTYALRVEGGISVDAGEAAAEVASILGDDRGWRGVEDVAFRQVATEDEADFTISIASPPTVDALCAPARAQGTWSCRIGGDVVLNSDRWTTMTPTYDDLGAYRTYMVNHEVGHFLGHDHVPCTGPGLAAPVMLQQSIDLGGCRSNPWPTADGTA